MSPNDPNPRCCYKPDVVVVFERERISLETEEVRKLAKCPNCGKLKDHMDTDHVRPGEKAF